MNYDDLYEISKDFNSLRVWLQEREVFRVNILIIAFYGGCRPHTPAFLSLKRRYSRLFVTVWHGADIVNNRIATAEHLLSMRNKWKQYGRPAPAKVQLHHYRLANVR